MITGYNTDVRHGELVVHVQTEDKGREKAVIESVLYVGGRVVATKRSTYGEVLADGGGDLEIAQQMDHQHRTILAAIKSGRFDDKLGATRSAAPAPAAPPADRLESEAATVLRTEALPQQPGPAAGEEPEAPEDEGPTLDQVILDYLSTEAEHEQLLLVIDGQEEIQPGRVNSLTLRAYSSKSGLPMPGVQVSVKMLSTVAEPRTLLSAETDDVGAIEMRLDVPQYARGTAALIISGSSDLGRAEIKQLL